jgi:transcription initiation factor TFIIIB Brf1 subunit/transcription initiation factor TFIIB
MSADLLLDKKSGDVICNGCGVIVCGRIIDEGNEVRNYGNDDDKPKVSRTSGFSESVGSLQTSFVTRCEETKRMLERAQAFGTPVEEQHVLRNMGSVTEMCGRLELVPCIKVSAG